MVRPHVRGPHRIELPFVAGRETSHVECMAFIVRRKGELGDLPRQPEPTQCRLRRNAVAEGDAVIVGAEDDFQLAPFAAGFRNADRDFIVGVADLGSLADILVRIRSASPALARDGHSGRQSLIALERQPKSRGRDQQAAVVGERESGLRLLVQRELQLQLPVGRSQFGSSRGRRDARNRKRQRDDCPANSFYEAHLQRAPPDPRVTQAIVCAEFECQSTGVMVLADIRDAAR